MARERNVSPEAMRVLKRDLDREVLTIEARWAANRAAREASQEQAA